MDPQPKSGRVRQHEYESELFLQKLDSVVSQLQADMPDSKFDRKSLAILLAQLLQFMEDALGKEALPPKPFPKLDVRLLRDYRPHGAVYEVARKCEAACKALKAKRIDFSNPARRKENIDLLWQIRAELILKGFLRKPCIHIHPSCGSEAGKKLQEAARSLGAALASAPDEPEVTHIVFPFGPQGDPDDGKQYMRNLGLRGSMALVHWWYLPDSYDELYPADKASENVEADKAVEGPWKVLQRWLTDSVVYNEWMNPIDYETEEALAEQEAAGRQLPGGQKVKRKLEEAPSSPSKRLTGATQLPTFVRVMASEDSEAQAEQAALNISQPQRPHYAAHGPYHGMPPAPEPAEPAPASRAASHTVPTCSAWFQPDSVHSIEQQLVLGPLEGSAASLSPQVLQKYKELRNALVAKYRESPSRRLHYADAAASLPDHGPGLLLIWSFLDEWGIINFQAHQQQRPSMHAEGQQDATPGQRMAFAPPLRHADQLFEFSPASAPAAAAAAAGNLLGDLVTRRSSNGASITAADGPKARYMCNALPWVDCTALRYHCTKVPDVDLCPAAFAEGRFPPGCCAQDFVRLDAAAMGPDMATEWSDHEVLALLEGVQLHGTSWAQVAQHVGSKSQVQCVMHFLQLPLEEECMGAASLPKSKGIELPDTATSNGTSGQPDQQGPDAKEQSQAAATQAPTAPPEMGSVPFADSGNPVMAQVAFLAAMVGPQVAAAAAQAALQALTDDSLPSDTKPAPAPGADAALGISKVQQAAAVGLAAAATKAKLLVESETREVQRAVLGCADLLSQRITGKLKYCDILEAALAKERDSLQTHRDQLFSERTQLQRAAVQSTPTVLRPPVQL